MVLSIGALLLFALQQICWKYSWFSFRLLCVCALFYLSLSAFVSYVDVFCFFKFQMCRLLTRLRHNLVCQAGRVPLHLHFEEKKLFILFHNTVKWIECLRLSELIWYFSIWLSGLFWDNFAQNEFQSNCNKKKTPRQSIAKIWNKKINCLIFRRLWSICLVWLQVDDFSSCVL